MLDVVQENTLLEDDSKDLFCGIARNKTHRILQPLHICLFLIFYVFLLVHPPDTNIYLVWIRQAFTIVQLDKNHS